LGRGQSGKVRLSALGFSYIHGAETHSFETLPFYTKHLRRFLKRHNGRACWVKGGVVRREAYLVFYTELAEEVIEMLSKPLEDFGFFTVDWVDPIKVVREAIKEGRVIIGYLRVGEVALGKPFTATLEEVKTMEYDPEDLSLGYLIRLKPPIRLGDTLIHFREAYAKKWKTKGDPKGGIKPREDVLIRLEDVELRSRARPEYRAQKRTLCVWLRDLEGRI